MEVTHELEGADEASANPCGLGEAADGCTTWAPSGPITSSPPLAATMRPYHVSWSVAPPVFPCEENDATGVMVSAPMRRRAVWRRAPDVMRLGTPAKSHRPPKLMTAIPKPPTPGRNPRSQSLQNSGEYSAARNKPPTMSATDPTMPRPYPLKRRVSTASRASSSVMLLRLLSEASRYDAGSAGCAGGCTSD